MIKCTKTLNSPFYPLCVNLGFADFLYLILEAFLWTFHECFYPDFKYTYPTVRLTLFKKINLIFFKKFKFNFLALGSI